MGKTGKDLSERATLELMSEREEVASSVKIWGRAFRQREQHVQRPCGKNGVDLWKEQ